MPKELKVPASPAQRRTLYLLTHQGKPKMLKGQSAREYRRFLRAWGAHTIAEVSREHDGMVIARLARDYAPALHTVTAEAVKYLLSEIRDKTERSPFQEDVLESLFEAAEKAVAAGDQYQPPEGVPEFDPSKEDWTPNSNQRQQLLTRLVDSVDGFDDAQVEQVIAFADTMDAAPDPEAPQADAPPEPAAG